MFPPESARPARLWWPTLGGNNQARLRRGWGTRGMVPPGPAGFPEGGMARRRWPVRRTATPRPEEDRVAPVPGWS